MSEEDLKKLVDSYQPDPSTLKALKSVTLLMIVGPSGVGKSSIAQASGLPIVIGETSRAKRIGEQEGIEYYFRTKTDMLGELSTGRYIQVVVGPAGDLYATHIRGFPEHGRAVFTVIAEEVPNLRRMPFKKTLTIFIVPPSHREWMRRLSIHKHDKRQAKKRLAEARRSFDSALKDKKIHFILNDDIQVAASQIASLLNGQTNEKRERLAKKISREIYKKIG